jgi:long-chain acyl-CoA synthetase
MIVETSLMPRETLLDFFSDLERTRGEFLVHDTGYRSHSRSYGEVARAAHGFAARLHAAGLRKGDKVLFWSENRPEWIAALWGCLLQGVVAVPIDYRASIDLLRRIRVIVAARVLLVGEEVTWTADEQNAGLEVWPLVSFDWSSTAAVAPAPVTRDDIAEVIFTSGARAEPKGVIITHRNLLANIVPVEREVHKYRRYARPFAPIRFLNLLPLSHMFGQAMATFVPPMLGGTVVFIRGYNPAEIARQIKRRRISVLVSVPKILDVLRDHVSRQAPEAAEPAAIAGHFVKRWWRYRRVHRMFGWKFWSFVVGAAPLDPSLEQYWGRLGFLVVQGYGLTETAPIVSLNHPFHRSGGSVGKALAGVEIRIAPDGEILVRGENVTTGYFGAKAADAEAFADGWFHTGDIGEMDAEGRLFIRGRKKEMIVTPEGLNVFPEDVERVLETTPGVREAAVVGIRHGSEERVHAVIVPEDHANPDDIVRLANEKLLDHQKIRGISLWHRPALPRTEGTRKLRRREVRDWVASGTPVQLQTAPPGDSVNAVLARFAAGRELTGETTIDELGLSSLERVELMVALEDRFATPIDEAAFSKARSLADLETLVSQPTVEGAETEPVTFPVWARGRVLSLIRRVSLAMWILPLARAFAWIRVEGLEHLRALTGPVVFAANHQSHMDTPAILASMPGRIRARVAVAMAKEFFRAHFFPDQHTRRQRFTNGLNYYLAAMFFNAFPLPQREAGARQTLRYIGDLLADGWSVLIFPEGRRTDAGEIDRFRPGIGMIGARLHVQIVPVRLEGLERVLHQKAKMARPAPVRIAFGPPLTLVGDDYEALAQRVETAVRNL